MQDKEMRERSIEAMERQAAMEPSHPKIARERQPRKPRHVQKDEHHKKMEKHYKKMRKILKAFAHEMEETAKDNKEEAAKARKEARVKRKEALTKERTAQRATAVADKVKEELQKHPEAESASAAESPVASSSDANTDLFAPLSK